MKKISTIGLSFLLIIGMASCGNSQNKNEKSAASGSATIAKNISTSQFQEMVKTKDNAIILDVRTPQEVASGAIEGNVALDYYGKGFTTELNKLDKNSPIFIYCAVGGRSRDAMRKMQKMGFKEVYNLSGGIKAWISDGKPVK